MPPFRKIPAVGPLPGRGFFRSDSLRCLRRPDFFLCDKKKPGKEKAPKETYSEAVSFGILPRRPREKPRGGFPHWILLPGTRGRRMGGRTAKKNNLTQYGQHPGFPPGGRSLLRCIEEHPEKQTTIAKQIQSRQADIPHPLVYRRTYAPFASAPAAPGCRGGALPRSFPGFSRARETGPPEASSGQISRAAHPRLP